MSLELVPQQNQKSISPKRAIDQRDIHRAGTEEPEWEVQRDKSKSAMTADIIFNWKSARDFEKSIINYFGT